MGEEQWEEQMRRYLQKKGGLEKLLPEQAFQQTLEDCLAKQEETSSEKPQKQLRRYFLKQSLEAMEQAQKTSEEVQGHFELQKQQLGELEKQWQEQSPQQKEQTSGESQTPLQQGEGQHHESSEKLQEQHSQKCEFDELQKRSQDITPRQKEHLDQQPEQLGAHDSKQTAVQKEEQEEEKQQEKPQEQDELREQPQNQGEQEQVVKQLRGEDMPRLSPQSLQLEDMQQLKELDEKPFKQLLTGPQSCERGLVQAEHYPRRSSDYETDASATVVGPKCVRKKRRIYFALVYRIAQIKLRRPWSSLTEFVCPLLIALLLVFPRLSYHMSFFPAMLWSGPSSNSNQTDSQKPSFGGLNLTAVQHTDYLRCPFGLYGPLAVGPLSQQILRDWAGHTDAGLNALLQGTNSSDSKDLSNLACNANYISKSPYLRPMFHFPRTLDGKFLAYLPFIAYHNGPIVFTSHLDPGTTESKFSATSCKAMQEFFDQFYYHLNPYVVASQKHLYKNDRAEAGLAFWAEADDITAFLTRTRKQKSWKKSQLLPENPPTTRPLLRFVRFYIKMLSGWESRRDPTIKALTMHIVHTVDSQNTASPHGWVDPSILRSYPVHTWVSCDERPKEGTPEIIGSLDFSIRMRSAAGTVVPTRGSPILYDGLLIPYNAEPSWKYFGGDMHPARRIDGGFMNVQSLLYAHVFNATAIRPIAYTREPLQVSQRVEARDATQQQTQGVTDNVTLTSPFATTIRRDAGSEIRCHEECVDYHVFSGVEFCNPACQMLYNGTIRKEPPLIRFKDSRAMNRLFLDCMRFPKTVKEFWPCIMGSVVASCEACRRFPEEFLEDVLVKIREYQTSNQNGISPDDTSEVFWSALMDVIIHSSHLPKNIDFSDALYCFGSIAWFSYVEGESDLLSPSMRSHVSKKTNNSTTGFNTRLLRKFRKVIFNGNCSATHSAIFYVGGLYPAWLHNDKLDASQATPFLYLAAHVLSNMWVSLKTLRLTELAVPLRFTENATPALETWFNDYVLIWLNTGAWGLLWTMVYLFVLYNVIRTLMVDQESRVKESFKIMGVPKWLLFSSVHSFYVIYLGVLSFLISCVAMSQYPRSSLTSIFLLNFLHCMSLLSFGFAVSACCSLASSTTAANVGAVLYTLSVIPQFACSLELVSVRSTFVDTLLLWLSPAAYAYGNVILLAYELPGRTNGSFLGISLRNLGAKYQGFSFEDILMALAADAILYLLVGLYVEELMPGVYGIPKRFYFPFQPTYWLPRWRRRRRQRRQQRREREIKDHVTIRQDVYCQRPKVQELDIKVCFNEEDNSSKKLAGGFFSREDNSPTSHTIMHDTTCNWALLSDDTFVHEKDYLQPSGPPIIEGARLQKIFGATHRCRCSAPIKALIESSLRVYKGEIFVLLGHNGAGKSTLISLLTGMLSPTQGNVTIMNYDMLTQSSECRKFIGFCPQNDFLFPELTVKEHLWLFCMIKGVPLRCINSEVKKIMRKLRLTEKADSCAGVLSGGQKRCLSVAIAVVGGSQAIFLDEPSTGMDPWTRRYLWDALKELRRDRAIILTTHFMEEAEFLSDRIAIMAGARIRCMGTSYFLKATYGAGYICTMVKRPHFRADHREHLLKIFPQAEIVSDAAFEISLRIPRRHSEHISSVLALLEANPKQFGITHFSIKLTTLEEVFLNINWPSQSSNERSITTEPHDGANPAMVPRPIQDENILHGVSRPSLSGGDVESPVVDVFRSIAELKMIQPARWRRYLHSIIALLKKRFWLAKRDMMGLFCQLILPVSFIIVSVLVTKVYVSVTSAEVNLDGSAYSQYPYQTLAPSRVLIGVQPGAAVAETAVVSPDRDVLARELTTCLGRSTHLDPRRVSESTSPSVQAFEGNMLATWDGGHPTNPELTAEYGSPRPRFLAYYFDLGRSFENDVFEFLSILMPNESPSRIRTIYEQWKQFQPQQPIAPPPLMLGWIFHNGTHRDALPTGMHLLASCIVQQRLLFSAEQLAPSISLTNLPLPQASSLDQVTLYVSMAVATIGATWGYYVVQERVTGAKKTQHAAGVSVGVYWFATALWDFTCFTVVGLIIFGLLNALHIDDLVASDVQGAFLCLLFVFGLASLPFSYLFAFKARSPVATQAASSVLGLFLPLFATTLKSFPATAGIYKAWLRYIFMVFPSVSLLMGLSDLSSFDYKKPGSLWSTDYMGLAFTYLCVEIGVFFGALLILDTIRVNKRAAQRWRKTRRFCRFWPCWRRSSECPRERAPFGATTAGTDAASNGQQLGSAISAQVERGVEGSALQAENERDPLPHGEMVTIHDDEDVVAERQFIQDLVARRLGTNTDRWAFQTQGSTAGRVRDDSSLLLTVEGLRKVFPAKNRSHQIKVAVDDLWFGVARGECLGFLGVNGAGKTTTMNMITGRTLPSRGTARVSGFDVVEQQEAATRRLGYCPQYDSCFDDLTGREHLELYLRLVMLPVKYLRPVVSAVAEAVGIVECANRPVRTYSGGNRRKLALALAFLNDPDVILLDEPSSGVDPASRRHLWTIISNATRHAGRSTVVTSHSMEECEALCDRIAIMQAGRLVCLGTPSHLRYRFGEGFQFEFTINPDGWRKFVHLEKGDSEINFLRNALAQFQVRVMDIHFPGSLLLETTGAHQRWCIPKAGTSLALIFEVAETQRNAGLIKDYGVYETTLDQIFVRFSGVL